MQNLLNKLAATWVDAAVSVADDTDSDSSVVDTANYEGVIFVVPITDSVATGVATLTISQGALANGSDMAALSGAVDTLTCAVNDDINGSLLVVDVYRPRERYVMSTITSATANIAFGDTIAIRYGARKQPTSHTGTVVASPAEA